MNRLHLKLEKIGSDPKITARSVGLRYAAGSVKGYYRKKKGDSFIYIDDNGILVTDQDVLDRIKKLVIPPAWENVWISPFENGHLQVTGIDAKGRKQYRYHSQWNKIRNQSKFYRLRRFAMALPKMRARVEKDLNKPGLPYEKVVALVVKLIEMTNIRIGNDAYKKLYGSFGLTTLRDKHVKINESTTQFEFVGKKGVKHSISLKSRKLANLVKKCKDIPGQDLFQYYDDNGVRHCIGSGDVNAYIKDIAEEDFTAKDFRAWAGSVNALCGFRQIGEFESPTECKRKVVEVIDSVAQKLGNTRTVCKKYYIDPTVIKAYENGRIGNYKTEANIKDNELNPDEEALVRLLENEQIAEVLA
jgi:DNA topoisomerase-1